MEDEFVSFYAKYISFQSDHMKVTSRLIARSLSPKCRAGS